MIGKAGRRISERDALEHVAAISICNEGTIRDWVRHAKFNVTRKELRSNRFHRTMARALFARGGYPSGDKGQRRSPATQSNEPHDLLFPRDHKLRFYVYDPCSGRRDRNRAARGVLGDPSTFKIRPEQQTMVKQSNEVALTRPTNDQNQNSPGHGTRSANDRNDRGRLY